jgi:DNA (cytosine-5)-methyltransferase 1
MSEPIKIIDLFAGPGGLSEGFSAYKLNNERVFKVAVSIEKEQSAHRTLLLRALFRQYEEDEVPEAYYAFLKGELGSKPEEYLYGLPEISPAIELARREALNITLGEISQRKLYASIREQVGSDECVLIGGPPCQAYSVVGRSRNYGAKGKGYDPSADHRNFLYLEYLKVIAKFQPKIFVMENVKGILSAKIDGNLIFESIQKDLQNPYKATKVRPDKGRSRHKYKIYSFVPNSGQLNILCSQDIVEDPHDFIIRAENYGVPQTRHRVILLGVRDDIAANFSDFAGLTLSEDFPTIEQVISDLPKLRSRLSKELDSPTNWQKAIQQMNRSKLKKVLEDKRVTPEVYEHLSQNLKGISGSPELTGSDMGMQISDSKNIIKRPMYLREWYQDVRLEGYITNHESRGHIRADLHRYLYYSSYAKVVGKSPTAVGLPKILWPQHKNFDSGKFADRFRVQISDLPATTITSHISKDGHYFIHYDPIQCRSLTVREAATVQTFPDNYHFVGTRTQQYVQVGNAVPPILAHKLAKVVALILAL